MARLFTRLLLLPAIFAAFCNHASAQSRSFTIQTAKSGFPCDSLYKEIEIRNVSSGKDSVIMRFSFFECTLRFAIDSPDSLFSVKITSENGESGQLQFNANRYTDSLNDLGFPEMKRATRQLDEFTVTGVKKSFIRVEADKKVVTVKDNPVLSVSSVYDAIIKIPGVAPLPGGGFAVGGKPAGVYFENVPSSLDGEDLMNLLRSLPATSVETIEIVSNPGASYDADQTGAIINIITMARVSGYISGTVTLNYGRNINDKFTPSFMLSGKTKKLSWQFNTGYSNMESSSENSSSRTFSFFDPEVNIFTRTSGKNLSKLFFFQPSINYKIDKRQTLVLKYGLSVRNSRGQVEGESGSQQLSPPVLARTEYRSGNRGLNNNASLVYRLNMDTLWRIFSATVSYSSNRNENTGKTAQFLNSGSSYSLINSTLNVQQLYARADFELPFDSLGFSLNTGVKASRLFVSNNGRYNLQNASADIFDNPVYNSAIDFDYDESNLAAYADVKKSFGRKFTLGAGLRAEQFTFSPRSNFGDGATTNYTNVFPSANAIYRLFPDIHLIATYSRKIGIPSYSQFDPNVTGYYDSFTSSTGNLFLEPNFYNNFEVKATVFDYLEVSMNYSHSSTLNLSEVKVSPNSISTVSTFRTYENVSSMSHYFALPVPLSFFRKGMQFFEEPIDIDNLNYLYLFANRVKTHVSGLELAFENKPVWFYGVYSQFILPARIKLYVNAWLAEKGVSQLYQVTRQQSGVEVIVSREFYNRKLRASVSVTDIFNRTETNYRVSFPGINLDSYAKNDTRAVWLKVSYSFGKFEKPQSEGFKGGEMPVIQP